MLERLVGRVGALLRGRDEARTRNRTNPTGQGMSSSPDGAKGPADGNLISAGWSKDRASASTVPTVPDGNFG